MRCRAARGALICVLTALSSVAIAFDASPSVSAAQGTLQAAFAPWDDVEGLILDALHGAKKEVLVQAYLLTSKRISTSLIAAQNRGVAVRVLLDADQARDVKSSKAADIVAAGIPVWLETRYQNAHNKVMIIDPSGNEPIVITGSFNFTWTAQHKNAENILVVRKNPALASRYAINWERHRQEATSYQK